MKGKLSTHVVVYTVRQNDENLTKMYKPKEWLASNYDDENIPVVLSQEADRRLQMMEP